MGVEISPGSVSVTLDPEYGYVILSALASQVALIVASGFVSKARKKYNVKYPTMYVCEQHSDNKKDAHAFNCVQRGHQNALETYPQFLTILFLAGLSEPVNSAIAGLIYSVGKIAYAFGYSISPDHRHYGGIAYIGVLYLMFKTAALGLQMAGII